MKKIISFVILLLSVVSFSNFYEPKNEDIKSFLVNNDICFIKFNDLEYLNKNEGSFWFTRTMLEIQREFNSTYFLENVSSINFLKENIYDFEKKVESFSDNEKIIDFESNINFQSLENRLNKIFNYKNFYDEEKLDRVERERKYSYLKILEIKDEVENMKLQSEKIYQIKNKIYETKENSNYYLKNKNELDLIENKINENQKNLEIILKNTKEIKENVPEEENLIPLYVLSSVGIGVSLVAIFIFPMDIIIIK